MLRPLPIARTVAAIALLAAAPHSCRAVDLAGRIVDDDGKPVVGATAFIYTAGVRHGTSPYCPGCYLDCGKTGRSDEAGKFVIKSLDGALIFQVLFIADGYKPSAMKKVDPLAPELTAKLERRPTLPDEPRRVIQGQVVDEQDKPVIGATIEVNDRQLPGGVTTGYPQGIDLVMFSDEQGKFAIVADEPILSVGLLVQARGAARRKFQQVTPGRGITLQLTRGHNFTGRVLADGKPLAGVVVGLVQTDRGSDGKFVGEVTAETDRDGVYRFYNAPPNDSLCLYGKMVSLAPRHGGIATIDLKSGPDGGATQFDDLILAPAHTIEGRIVLADGKPIPAGTRLLASRETAWDSQTLEVDENGGFRLEGLPTEVYSLTAQVKGYRMSTKNKSLDVLNRYSIKGLVNASNNGLVILLEPGEMEQPDYNGPGAQAMFAAFQALDKTPLTGAE